MNVDGDPSINLLATVIIILLLLVHLIAVGKVYKSKLLGILELSFLLNLIVLSVSSLFSIPINKGQEIVTNNYFGVSDHCYIWRDCDWAYICVTEVLETIQEMDRARKDVIANVSDMQHNRELRPVTLQVVSLDDLQDPLLEN